MPDREPDDHRSSDPAARVAELVAAIAEPDARVAADAAALQDRLTKPRGALGRLETLGIRLCVISGTVPPPVPAKAAVAVFAGDHGVLDEGVSPWPQEVTAQMVANLCAGGAAINVLARQAGAEVIVVDVGVAGPVLDHPGLRRRRVRSGTANLAQGPAMTVTEARSAILVGAEVAADLVAGGADLLVGGDMGIGNTTPSAALIAAITGRDPAAVTGRGTGIDDAMLQHKADVVADAVARVRTAAATGPDATGLDAVGLLAEIGGLEIAALAGFYLGAAAAGVPVVLDGVIALAAACVAAQHCPAVTGYLIAGHRSTEPGATAALDWLGLEPLVDLGMRLGEGSGAMLGVPLVRAAAAVMNEMATFDSAGVADKAE